MDKAESLGLLLDPLKVDDFKKYVTNNKSDWFDIIFDQNL